MSQHLTPDQRRIRDLGIRQEHLGTRLANEELTTKERRVIAHELEGIKATISELALRYPSEAR